MTFDVPPARGRCSLRAALAVAAFLGAAASCAPTRAPRSAPTASRASLADAAFLDTLERRTFDFFWETTDARTGLTPDRWPTRTFSSVAAIGFALTAYPVGAERGYITRGQSAERTLATLHFLWRLPMGPDSVGVAGYRGFYYHFLDFERGLRYRTVELSTIDTALLLAGALFAQQYYDRGDVAEVGIRAYADSIYRRVDWRSMQPKAPLVSHGWHPEIGFIVSNWVGYDESMILYLLALGSPTHAVDSTAWAAYTKTYTWASFHGEPHVNFGPLFGHQYSHVWVDFRGVRDAYMREHGIDYFENSRRATTSDRAYAIANPGAWRGYSADVWGLTASDGPADTTLAIDGRRRLFFTYGARAAAATELRDDGTLAPTAAGGSIAFAPGIVIPALRAMRARYGDDLFARYGFLDAFNPTFDAPGAQATGRVVPAAAGSTPIISASTRGRFWR